MTLKHIMKELKHKITCSSSILLQSIAAQLELPIKSQTIININPQISLYQQRLQPRHVLKIQ